MLAIDYGKNLMRLPAKLLQSNEMCKTASANHFATGAEAVIGAHHHIPL